MTLRNDRRVARSTVPLLALLICGAPGVAAQRPGDTAAVAAPAAQPDSATRGRVGPFGAMWRSLLLPGWGQAATGRHVTGALFVAWEGVTAMMTLKAKGEERYLESIESSLVDAKRDEVQDWAVLWVFNHLFAGAEAFVAAHLRAFPEDLEVRAVPRGVAFSIPLP
jgi:hypothetical protein